LSDINRKTLIDTACNRCRRTKDIQNICHNKWSVSTICQTEKNDRIILKRKLMKRIFGC